MPQVLAPSAYLTILITSKDSAEYCMSDMLLKKRP